MEKRGGTTAAVPLTGPGLMSDRRERVLALYEAQYCAAASSCCGTCQPATGILKVGCATTLMNMLCKVAALRPPGHEATSKSLRLDAVPRQAIRPDPAPARSETAALDALSDVSVLRGLLDRAELNAVRLARRHGHSWAEVATRLGVTRQSAWERGRDLDDEPAETGSLQATAAAEAANDLVSRAAALRRRQAIVTVPDVVGLTFGEARSVLSGRGLVATDPDPDEPPLTAYGWPGGVVTDQSPESGSKVAAGSAVRLWIGRGGGSAGVREPRRPGPDPKGLRATRDEPAEQAENESSEPFHAAGRQHGGGRKTLTPAMERNPAPTVPPHARDAIANRT